MAVQRGNMPYALYQLRIQLFTNQSDEGVAIIPLLPANADFQEFMMRKGLIYLGDYILSQTVNAD